MSNVLVVGNGFDLYHFLPTRYIDFLFFVNHWNTFAEKYALASIEVKPDQCLEIRRGESGMLTEESICDFAKYRDAYNAGRLEKFKENYQNHWVGYFNYLLKSEMIGENWIDFEEEIQKALEFIDIYFELVPKCIGKPINAYLPIRALDFIREFNKTDSDSLILNIGVAGRVDPMLLLDHKKKYINYVLNELNKLTCCLSIYILEFVSRIECNYFSEQIGVLDEVHLLNFNYTDTFKYVYDRSKLIENHSVHGNAKEDNIVLGVPDDSFEGTEYIYFQKFFQRIQKRTGSFYQSWLHIPRQSTIEILAEEEIPCVYIFGHSLAETDKGILKDIFLNTNIDTIVIFYHSQSAYERMVINLIRMFGKDFVISNTGSGRIKFQKLEPAKLKE